MLKKVDWASVKPVLETYPNVIATWCFGSSQDGYVGEQSDLDIAVFFQSAPSVDDLVALQADLQKVFQYGQVDLLVLNDASPLIRFKAVSGRSLFCRDLIVRAEFVSLAAREFESAIAFLRRGLKFYPTRD